jgi:hypothetical protein
MDSLKFAKVRMSENQSGVVMSMEHRCGSRQAANVAVVITTFGGLVGKGTVRQMSASGALIHSSLRLRPDSVIDVRFCPGGRRNGRPRLGLTGEVVRCTAEGFAVQWLEFEPDVVRALLESASRDTLSAPHNLESTLRINA